MTYSKNRQSTNCDDCEVPEWVFCGSTNFELVNGKCEFIRGPNAKQSRPVVNTCAPRTFLGIPMPSLLGCDRLRPECGAFLELDHAGLQCAATPCPNDGVRYPDGICRPRCERGEVLGDDGVCRDWGACKFTHYWSESEQACVPKQASVRSPDRRRPPSPGGECPKGSFYFRKKDKCIPWKPKESCTSDYHWSPGKQRCVKRWKH